MTEVFVATNYIPVYENDKKELIINIHAFLYVGGVLEVVYYLQHNLTERK